MCRLIIIILLFSVVVFSDLVLGSTRVNICIPDQSVPPFYIIEKNRPSGITIDHLKELFQQPALQKITSQFVLQPWQRCIESLGQGEVDVIIAGYSEERAVQAVFPDTLGFYLSESAFSYAQICLVKGRYKRWTWNGQMITGLDKLRLGLEPGFLAPQSEQMTSMTQFVAIKNTSQKYELIKLDQVDAVLTVCGVMDRKIVPDNKRISPELEVIYPPYIDSPVYLTFSQRFFETSPELATLIVETSNQFIKTKLKVAN